MMHKTIKRLLSLAMPAGACICLCSAAFSVNFMILDVPVPKLTAGNAIEIIMYAVRIGTGLSLSVAQIYSLIIMHFAGDRRERTIYYISMAISIYMSIATFYGMILNGLVAAEDKASRLSKESVEYTEMLDRIAYAKAAIKRIENDRKSSLATYDKYNRASKKIAANKEYDDRVYKYERMIRELVSKISKYNYDNRPTLAGVTVHSVHAMIAKDVVKFFSIGTTAEMRIDMILQYSLIILIAVVLDLVGTGLILTGVKKEYFLKKIVSKLEIESPKISPMIYAGNEEEQNSEKQRKIVGNFLAESAETLLENFTPENDGEKKKYNDIKELISVSCEKSKNMHTPPEIDIYSLKISSEIGRSEYGEMWGEFCGDSLRVFSVKPSENFPPENVPNETGKVDGVFSENNAEIDIVKILDAACEFGAETVLRVYDGLVKFDTLKDIRAHVFPGKYGSYYNRKIKDIAAQLGVPVPNATKVKDKDSNCC